MSLIVKKKDSYQKVPLRLIDPPNEADRLEISAVAIDELSDSLAEIGLLSPILLSVSAGRFEIVFGHRRFLAAQKLGWSDIHARVVEYTPAEMSIARASENLQREDLTPIEEALIYSRLVNVLKMTVKQVHAKTGKSPGIIKRRMDLLRMPESFRRALHGKLVSVGVAEELWSCSDNAHREYLLEMAVDHGITVAVARQWVQDYRKAQRTQAPDNGRGGGARDLAFDQKIFRSCDACQQPVELCDVQEVRCCAECYGKIAAAIRGEGG